MIGKKLEKNPAWIWRLKDFGCGPKRRRAIGRASLVLCFRHEVTAVSVYGYISRVLEHHVPDSNLHLQIDAIDASLWCDATLLVGRAPEA